MSSYYLLTMFLKKKKKSPRQNKKSLRLRCRPSWAAKVEERDVGSLAENVDEHRALRSWGSKTDFFVYTVYIYILFNISILFVKTKTIYYQKMRGWFKLYFAVERYGTPTLKGFTWWEPPGVWPWEPLQLEQQLPAGTDHYLNLLANVTIWATWNPNATGRILWVFLFKQFSVIMYASFQDCEVAHGYMGPHTFMVFVFSLERHVFLVPQLLSQALL